MAVIGAPNFDRMRYVANEVAADAERDAGALDGQPNTPLTIGTNFGQVYASLCALGKLAATQLDMIEALREEVRDLREWKDDHDAA